MLRQECTKPGEARARPVVSGWKETALGGQEVRPEPEWGWEERGRTRERAAPTGALDAPGQVGAAILLLGPEAPGAMPQLVPPHCHSVATHQQRQRDGHEHGTARHAGQADEVQGPPASSLHHEQLRADTESAPPTPAASLTPNSIQRLIPNAGKATRHCRHQGTLHRLHPGAQLGDYTGLEGRRAGPGRQDGVTAGPRGRGAFCLGLWAATAFLSLSVMGC